MRRILTPAEYRAQPWKNGGGVTHEIVRWPDTTGGGAANEGHGSSPSAVPLLGEQGEGYEIRISIADDRTPGPFSRFPGYRRWSFLAGHAPIVLDVAGTVRELVALGDHLEVGGDVAITCALPAGPTRLFNILVRDGIDASVGRGPCPLPIRFAFALAALPWLPAGHAAVFDPPEIAALTDDAVWLR